jgi:hypothetical protein
MSHNRDLVDTIKQNFARKSSAQLQEIVQSNNPERWSPEAVAAAGEVLQDRIIGIAQEPLVAEGEPPIDEVRLAAGVAAARRSECEDTAAIVERLRSGGEL